MSEEMEQEEIEQFWEVLSPGGSETEYNTSVIYGPSGCGKTTLASCWPDPLFLACDPGKIGGLRSIMEVNPKWLKVPSWYILDQDILPKLEATAGKAFQTLVIDSISYLQRIIMGSILSTVGLEIPRFEQWNLLVERMRRLVQRFGELNCHKVYTATDNLIKDEVSGRTQGGPNLPGQLAKELPQASDVVIRLHVLSDYDSKGRRITSYKMCTVPDDQYYAKDRTKTLPAEADVSMSSLKDGCEVLKPLFEKMEA